MLRRVEDYYVRSIVEAAEGRAVADRMMEQVAIAKTEGRVRNMLPKFAGFWRTIIPSVIEAFGVVSWLHTGLPQVLYIFLSIEHLVTQAIYNYKEFNKNILAWLGVSLFETIVWIVWRTIPGLGAYLELYGGLLVEHTVSENILQGRAIFSRLLAQSTVLMTAIETVNAFFLSGTAPVFVRLVGGSVLYTAEHDDELNVASTGA